MTVRRFTRDDVLSGEKVRSVAFVQLKDMTQRAEKLAQGRGSEEKNWWGCFADDGNMAACLVNHDYRVHFDGHAVKMGGVGGVATLPEYRSGGAVRSLFRAVLDDAYENGEVFSALYPFSHPFYRKFGYEVFFDSHRYEIEPPALQKFRTDWRIQRLEDGCELPRLTQLHNEFAARYNCCVIRTDENTARENGGDTYRDGISRYLLEYGGDAAYVTYHSHREGVSGERVVDVKDFACFSPDGFNAILALLGRLTAEYKLIRLRLPPDFPLEALVDTPRDFRHTVVTAAQLRLTNVSRALSLLRKPKDSRLIIDVADDFMPQNNRTFSVEGNCVAPCREPPDLSLDVRTLTQLCIGYLDFDGALYKPDVRVHDNEASLRAVFRKRPVFLNDSF